MSTTAPASSQSSLSDPLADSIDIPKKTKLDIGAKVSIAALGFSMVTALWVSAVYVGMGKETASHHEEAIHDLRESQIRLVEENEKSREEIAGLKAEVKSLNVTAELILNQMLEARNDR